MDMATKMGNRIRIIIKQFSTSASNDKKKVVRVLVYSISTTKTSVILP